MSKRDKDWEKFGSSYDPKNGGKQQAPRTAADQSRIDREREEQMQVRGCGDPYCPQCNPEIAYRMASNRGGTVTGRTTGRGPDFTFLGMDDFARLESVLLGRLGAATPARPKNEPPESYTKAREEVEDWIQAAPTQDFDDIVGNDEALEQLRDAIQAPIKHKELYEAYGMKMPKGALLSGPPGCGKTMFARAAASEMARLYGDKKKPFEFISINGSELQSMFIGQTEGYIKSIFSFAREYKAWHGYPLLVFMDEAEVLLPDRTGRVRRVASWEESQVATFLAEMDGIQESGAFMLLATNRPEVIDQAVLRDGRCDFKITVKRPTLEAVEIILSKNFDGILLGGDTKEQLVFAAVESLSDPHKIIMEAHALGVNFEERQIKDVHQKHFLLEHIVSGAMAASIPNRAKRYAFARDKLDGVARGVTVADVVKAVNDLFEENKALDHAFALDEFRREFMVEATAIQDKGGKTKH